MAEMEKCIAIIGVGYVGLPLALTLAKHHQKVIGFDIDTDRIAALQAGINPHEPENQSIDVPDTLAFTSDPNLLKDASTYILTVPTPVDEGLRPDLDPLRKACRLIGKYISKGDLIIVESTVYPGATREDCGPLIAECSGLRQGIDFQLGYSPERINPGDTENTLETVIKIVSGQDDETLERVVAIYEPAVQAGLHKATSMEVAEAAKITENIQRDLNIALMNELAMIFDRMNVRTADVIEAAATKWNFQKFTPGLVGGHCIGVDPYYLISRAEALGHYPEVIRAARRLNNNVAPYIARRTVELLISADRPVRGARIGVLGVTFKENVSDCRNTHTPEIIRELKRFGAVPLAHDPLADPDQVREEYGIELVSWDALNALDGIILTVPHQQFLDLSHEQLFTGLTADGIFIDIKSALDPRTIPAEITYWSL